MASVEDGKKPTEQSALLAKEGHAFTAKWAVAASSIGILADAYDLFAIDLVLLVLVAIHGETVISARSKALIAGAAIAGIIIGQLSFGFVADKFGRVNAFLVTSGLTILGALMSAVVVDTGGSFGIVEQLAVCRFVLGVGIGGEYPLSASVTAERSSDPSARGTSLVTVISMQGYGMLLSPILCLLALPFGLAQTWRGLLAFGAIPAMIAFGLRWNLHESEDFAAAKSSAKPASAREQLQDTFAKIARCKNTLAGTAMSWFLMNMALYSLGTFKSQLVQRPDGRDVMDEIHLAAKYACFTSCCAILGFWAAIMLINRLGRRNMQLMGFLVLSAVFLFLSALSAPGQIIPNIVIQVCLGIIFFFLNLGPNATTYVVPAEAFPTLVRASCHGISAATGKCGALLGSAMFPLLMQSVGMRTVYAAFCTTALSGALITAVFTPRVPGQLCELDRK